MSDEPRMTIEFFDDGTPPDGPVFKRLAQQEKKLAEKEDRKPEGWMWVEGMDRPRNIDFDALEGETRDD